MTQVGPKSTSESFENQKSNLEAENTVCNKQMQD